jgi:small subunit ribosomal protein S17
MQRTFKGKIISLKMEKTAVVKVTRRSPHPLYRKLMVKNTNYKADTAGLTLEVGQNVKIAETRPMSKGKFFKVLEVIK